MVYRRSNLPIDNARCIFKTNDYLSYLDEIIDSDDRVMKILQFTKGDVLNYFRDTLDKNSSKIICEYIIRMASRTEIQQMFGELEGAKDTYILSPEFFIKLRDNIVYNNYINNKLTLKLNSFLDNKLGVFVFHKNMGAAYKIKQNSILGRMLTKLKVSDSVHSDVLHTYANSIGMSSEIYRNIILQLIREDIIITNLNFSVIGYSPIKIIESFQKFLDLATYNQLLELNYNVEHLYQIGDNPTFFSKLEQLNNEVTSLLELQNNLNKDRYINGYGAFKKQEQDTDNTNLKLSKLSQQFFTALGRSSKEYLMCDRFKEYFIGQYGMFNSIPLNEAIQLFKTTVTHTNNILDKNTSGSFSYFDRIIKDFRKENSDIIELSNKNLRDYMGKVKATQRTWDFDFEVKFRKYNNKFILSTSSFSIPNATFAAYTKKAPFGFEHNKFQLVAIDYCPNYLPSLGISLVPSNGIRRVGINTHEAELSLSDIEVFVDFNGFNFIDTKNNELILPYNQTKINYSYSSQSIYALFLDLMSKYIIEMPSCVLPINTKFHDYIPRIQYKNLILFRKTWFISVELELSAEESLQRYLEKFPVDGEVALLDEFGNELFIDIESPLGQETLLKYLKKMGRVQLFEHLIEGEYVCDSFDLQSFPTESPRISQDVFYLKNKSETTNKYQSWHITYNEEMADVFFDRIFKSVDDKTYFFIHYVEDGKKVLRLRINNNDMGSCFLSNLEEMLNENTIISYAKHKYTPEVNRYGGQDIFPYIQSYFERESRLIKNNFLNLSQADFITSAVIANYSLLKECCNDDELHYFIKKFFFRLDNTINKPKRNYKSISKQELDVRIELLYDSTAELFSNINQEFANIAMKIKANFSIDYFYYVLLSVCHMRFNRMNGLRFDIEGEVNELILDIYKYKNSKKIRRE